MNLGLEDSVVIVSGAAGGIGLAICEALLAEGAIVAPLCRDGADRLAALYESPGSAGMPSDRIVPLTADLTDAESLERAVQLVLDRFGRIDVLVNNAGTAVERPFLAMTETEGRDIFDVNVWGTLGLTRLVLKPMMRARKGSVVNVTSVVASRGGRGVSVYAMTKAALEKMTRSVAIEMAPKGIRLNAVAPGVIDTAMSTRLRNRRRANILDRIPQHRTGLPEDVAGAVVWVASDVAARYVTGQVITVDGGMSL